MAIRILNRWGILACFVALVGCQKWADGVVNEIDFPDHVPTTAASCILTTGDAKAILSVTNTSSLLSVTPIDLPDGVSATLEHNGSVVLSWGTEDVGLVDNGFASAQDMLVLNLDAPLSLPVGEIELTVNIPGEDPLTALAVQPAIPQVSPSLVLGLDTLPSIFGNEILDELHLDLINREGVRDVYSLRLQDGHVVDGDTLWQKVYSSEFDDPRLDYVSSCYCWIVDDQNVDAQTLDDLVLNRMRWLEEDGEDDEVSLRLIVEQLDPSLGDFYRSVDNHEDAQNNPFANPSGIYSNTSTGYGHFGLAARQIILMD